MNTGAWHLRRRDMIVLAACTAFLLAALGAVGEGGRRRAKEMVCQAYLHQWAGVFRDYIQQNDGKFFSGCNANGHWWPLQLPLEQQDWKRNRTWFCPTATIPVTEALAVPSTSFTIFNAWGILKPPTMIYQGKTYVAHSNGLAGSYGLNGYTLNISETATYEGGASAKWGWRDILDVTTADRVPMFTDAHRFDVWPRETNVPVPSEGSGGTGNGMNRCCLNWHNAGVSCLFVDGSVRKVGLKELWTLKWHKVFNTAGPWTKAGGVLPNDWPLWMREFKDY